MWGVGGGTALGDLDILREFPGGAGWSGLWGGWGGGWRGGWGGAGGRSPLRPDFGLMARRARTIGF